VSVALNLEVRVSQDYAVQIFCADYWARDQEIRELNLEEHQAFLKEEQRSIN
jgi:hypothetical protein